MFKILNIIKNKALLNLKADNPILREVCQKIIKEEIKKVPHIKKIRKIRKLICYVNISNMSQSSANKYIDRLKPYLNDFFQDNVLIFPIQKGDGETRIEMIEEEVKDGAI